jgi:uncharacterized LabA/DUF88 family protein
MKSAGIFIDGANLFFTQRHLGWSVDFSRLITDVMNRYSVVQANYYVPESRPASEEQTAFDRMLLANGYSIIVKPVKKIVNKDTGEIVMKGNLDIELAVDALMLADRYDVFMLFSGDSDFLPLLRALKGKGKEIEVFSTPGISARELVSEPGITFHDLERMRERLEQGRSAGTDTDESPSKDFSGNLPPIGEVFTGTVLSVKPYGIFLGNPYHAKCLLPLGFLGVSRYIAYLPAIVRMTDLFEVSVFRINTEHEVPEITVKLIDRKMTAELTERID